MMDQESSSLEQRLRGMSSKKVAKRVHKLQERLLLARQAQTAAAERLQRAQARWHKKSARVKRLEERLVSLYTFAGIPIAEGVIQTAPEVLSAKAISSPASTLEGTVADASREQPVEEGIETVPSAEEQEAPAVPPTASEQITAQMKVSPATLRALEHARQARMIANAAEEEARLAIERSQDAAERLEQMVTGRHLAHELVALQEEAEKASTFAHESEQAARIAEQQVPYDVVTLGASLAEPDTEHPPAATIAAQDEPQPELTQQTAAIPQEVLQEEEAVVEHLAAMMIAEAAAIAAVEAEAAAEESSARTREARQQARQADQVLLAVRRMIREGSLPADEAEQALQAAEYAVTHAHALLADAEGAEEQALNAAISAEADAEVAEGMALAAAQRDEDRDLAQRAQEAEVADVPPSAVMDAEDTGDVDEDDDTLEMPVVRPPESQ